MNPPKSLLEINMLPWQKEYIQRNMSALVECSSKLIANLLETDDLSASDFDSQDNSTEQLSRLYEALQFSAKGYETLTRAAYETKQTKILKILLNGLKKHGLTDPFKQCRIPISISAIRSTDIWMNGSKLKVGNVFSELDLSTLEEIIQDYHLEEDYIDTVLAGELQLPETIPVEPAIYIPRLVSNRLKLNPVIFEENLEDLFLFEGLKHYELSKVANKNITTTFKQIIENKVINKRIRFIRLEDSHKTNWGEILTLSGETSVHLVKVEKKGHRELQNIKDAQYILEATNNFQSIQKWVAKQPKEMAAYIPEDDFVKSVANNKGNPGFCICDTPGMGKSFLLESLARKIQASHSKWVVVYAKLANFIKYLRKEETRLRVNPEIAPNLILEHIITSQILVRLLVEAFTRGSKRLELFLDGLDELTSEEDLKLMKVFLEAIVKFQTGRGNVYVTARPHVEADLEETLGVAPYDILPFSPENQIEFLKKSWMEKCGVEGEKKSELLEGFAKSCLKKIEKTFSDQVKELMGVPLKCFLLAGIHEGDAERVLNNEIINKETIITNYSIYDLLDKYIESRKSSRNDCNWEDVKNFHMWKALEAGYARDFARKFHDFKKVKTEIPEEYYSFGILTKSAKGPVFIHQTFREFLVIQCFGELIQSVSSDLKESSEDIIECLATLAENTVFRRRYTGTFDIPRSPPSNIEATRRITLKLYTFLKPLYIYFFNKYLSKINDSIDRLTSNKILAASLQFIYEEPYTILQCCIENNYIHVVQFIKKLFLNGWKQFDSLVKPSILSMDPDENIEQSPIILLVLVAARTSSVEIMMELEELLGKCNKTFDQVQFPISKDFKVTPLQIAVESGNSAMFEYHLKNNYSYKPEELLLWCTNNSVESESWAVEGKQEICKFFISNIHKLRIALEDAIYEKNVHPDLISFLLDELDNCKPNPGKFENASVLKSNSTMLSILTKLIKNIILPSTNSADHISDSLLKRILDKSSFSLKLIDERVCKDDIFKDNLLVALVRRNRGRVVLEGLQNCGLIDLKTYGHEVLHVATRFGNMEAIKYLHEIDIESFKLSLEEPDSEGYTPLLRAYRNPEMIACLLELGAEASATHPKSKKNLLHLLSEQAFFYDEDKFERNLSLVKVLTKGKISVNAEDAEGRFPLLCFLKYSSNYTEIADVLLEHGADINAVCQLGYNAIFWGVYHSKNSEVEYLERNGAEWKGVSEKSGDNILHMAVRGANTEFLEYIFSKPDYGDINLKNKEGKTPIMLFMAYKGPTSIVTEMINLFASKGAELNAVDNEGNNLIFLAVYHEQPYLVLDLLQEKKVCWKCKDRKGDSILHVIAKRGKYQYLKYFLSRHDGDGINELNFEGKTPLLSAITKAPEHTGRDVFIPALVEETLKLLISKNADINAVNRDENNALHLSLISGMPIEIIELLEEGRCNPEMPNKSGKTFNDLFEIACRDNSRDDLGFGSDRFREKEFMRNRLLKGGRRYKFHNKF